MDQAVGLGSPLNVPCLLLFVIGAWAAEATVKGPFDICNRDVFNASCPDGHMIMMQSAMYGRMSLGTCITIRHAINTDCDADVLHILDGMCSGQQHCTVRPINPIFFEVQKCPQYAAYLRVSYKCMPTVKNSHSCQGTLPIEGSSGFLSTVQRPVNGAGTVYCPWVVNPSGSQRVNITLYKFVPFKKSPLSSSSSVCFDIGSIQEAEVSHGLLSCGSDPRQKVAYLSNGGPVRIHLKEDSFLRDLGQFALHFEALGCTDPEIPQHASHTRHGNDVTITCLNEVTSWKLRCENGRWEGEAGICPAAANKKSISSWFRANTTYSIGLLFFVTLGCAIFIFCCGFCLYVTQFYVRKQHQQTNVNMDYTHTMDIYKLQTMQRLKASRPPSIAVYERTTSLHTPPGTMRRNTDYQRMNPIDPDTVSHHSYVLYDHVPKPLPPIPIQDIASSHEKKHIYETPLRPNQQL